MLLNSNSSLIRDLSKPTPFVGIKLWISIVICIAIVVFLLLFLFLCITCHRLRKIKSSTTQIRIPKATFLDNMRRAHGNSSVDRRLISVNTSDTGRWELPIVADQFSASSRVLRPHTSSRGENNRFGCREFTLQEMIEATNGWDSKNLVQNGDCGIVYRGVLLDGTRVVIKQFQNGRVGAEEIRAEAEAIQRLTHKNVVKLIGFCVEGDYRVLVHEYVDNGDLYEWLHAYAGRISPLTWDMRMHIVRGIAKALAYLHEDVEPKVLHCGLKSTNILLDRQWNPKISNIGFARLLGPECRHSTDLSGYAAPECDLNDIMVSEKADVYSFGILVMEIISARTPIDHNKPQEEMYLVDWLKTMVSLQLCHLVVDCKIPVMPPLKELKRVLLIALRCVDPDAGTRPEMGEVIHMLEPRDLLLHEEFRREETSYLQGRQLVCAKTIHDHESEREGGTDASSNSSSSR
ncbi:hypothetical protein Ancab_009787 [Ancistrocladus abbreviatus]